MDLVPGVVGRYLKAFLPAKLLITSVNISAIWNTFRYKIRTAITCRLGHIIMASIRLWKRKSFGLKNPQWMMVAVVAVAGARRRKVPICVPQHKIARHANQQQQIKCCSFHMNESIIIISPDADPFLNCMAWVEWGINQGGDDDKNNIDNVVGISYWGVNR